ncbi:MAG: Ig-like domain-containing protein [Phycisphaerae bacterium]
MNSRSIARISVSGVALAAVAVVIGAQDRGHTVKSLPPVVVKTVPQSGDTAVDASKVTEVRVTFSKEMADGNWSWVDLSADTKLPIDGKPMYEKDRRTCVVKVKLEPGKTYAAWLNSEKFKNFRDGDGNAGVPYLLVFETKPASAAK